VSLDRFDFLLLISRLFPWTLLFVSAFLRTTAYGEIVCSELDLVVDFIGLLQ